MKKNGRRKWKRQWDKKLLLLMPKQPKLTKASTKMLCRHPLRQTMYYWTTSQKVSKQQQGHDSDSTCNFISAGYPSSCHLPGLTGLFTSRRSTCHSYKFSSSCAGTLYMILLFVSNAFSLLLMTWAMHRMVQYVLSFSAGLTDRQAVPGQVGMHCWGWQMLQCPQSQLLCLALSLSQMHSICIHQLFHTVLLFLVLY